MKSICYIILLLLISFSAFSQEYSDTIKIAQPSQKMPLYIDMPLQKTPNLYDEYMKEAKSDFLSPKSKNNKYNLKSNAFTLPEMNFGVENYITQTTPNPLAVRTPLSYDFKHSGFMRVSRNGFLNTFQNRQTYMLIGTKESVGGQYTHIVNDKLVVSTGVSVDKYRESAKSKYDVDLNANATYKFSDRAKVTAFVSHSFDPNKTAFSRGMYSSHPQTYYGAVASLYLTDRLEFQPSVYGTNYRGLNGRTNDFGFGGNIGYWITDRVKVGALGLYSLHNNYGANSPISGMYPQTQYGGYFEFKMNDSWGLRGGAVREYDPFRRKWTTKPYFEIVTY